MLSTRVCGLGFFFVRICGFHGFFHGRRLCFRSFADCCFRNLHLAFDVHGFEYIRGRPFFYHHRGSFGKFFLFAAALRSTSPNLGLLWLVILALGFSVVSLYYYLQVLKQIYVADSAAEAVTVRPRVSTQIILGGLAVMVVLLGAMPGAFLTRLQSAIQAAGF